MRGGTILHQRASQQMNTAGIIVGVTRTGEYDSIRVPHSNVLPPGSVGSNLDKRFDDVGYYNGILDSNVATGDLRLDYVFYAGLRTYKDAAGTQAAENNDGVRVWRDVAGSGSLFQTMGGKYPTYIVSAYNGFPAIRFDGVNDYLASDETILSAKKTSDQHMFFVLSNIQAAPLNGAGSFGWGGGILQACSCFLVGRADGVEISIHTLGSGILSSAYSNSLLIPKSVDQIVGCISIEHAMNRISLRIGSTAAITYHRNFSVFHPFDHPSFNGIVCPYISAGADVHEFFVYSGTLNKKKRYKILMELSQKYRIPM